VLISVFVYCALICVDGSRSTMGASPRVDPDGQPACELCGRRLSKVKHHRPYGIGRVCHPRCHDSRSAVDNGEQPLNAATTTTTTTMIKEKKRRRVHSDPGKLPSLTIKRLRVRATKPTPPDRKKQKQEKEAEITALLDQTHARRMAALSAAASAAASIPSTPSTPSTPSDSSASDAA
jgi:hypothetical protein